MFYYIIRDSLSSLGKFKDTLDTRMRRMVKYYNSDKYHGFKTVIVTLKSKRLMQYINHLGEFKDKVADLYTIQDIMFRVAKCIYKEYDPHVIYTFGNEIDVVFHYNDRGDFVYDGNIHKTLTSLASIASIETYRLLRESGINLDCYFTAHSIEFDVDYEPLNYLIWRQMDCRRNMVTLLYKCLHVDSVLDGKYDVENMKIKDMIGYLDNTRGIDVENDLREILTGNIVKKYMFQIKREESKFVSRRSVGVDHFYFSDNFKQTWQRYITDKVYTTNTENTLSVD